ncbi:MAG: HAMP domain-containing protein [Lachnospiraceae bacterium]|nr:HAMP domain-containing protein [Lachnospiraceae bacterium]
MNVWIVVSDGSDKIYSTTNEKGMMFDSITAMTHLITDPDYLPEGEAYIIEIHNDDRMRNGYYDLVGYLTNGYMIVIRTPIEFVSNSAKFSNRIFLYFSLAVLILDMIVMSLLIRVYTKPIQEMADVAKRMSNLDFDAKINVHSQDEIGELGESMNHLSNRLESTISELKSANAELHQDIEKKVQIDEMRKEFLSHVSHELKTPIALIQGYAEGLKESVNDDPESRDFYCDVIMDEANKMNIMVKKLLSLNELENGNEHIEVSRFDIVELIRNICASSDILVDEESNRVIFEEKGPVYVWADEFMIEEVITNYVTNAIHYVSSDGDIRIYFKQLEKELQIVVYNTEPPIPEEELDKLWIKFYKVDKARTREYSGSGIGLSIVAAIMKAHDKEYGVRNVDDGVEFYCNLDTDIS